jgi:hypothetical protein
MLGKQIRAARGLLGSEIDAATVQNLRKVESAAHFIIRMFGADRMGDL